MREWFGGLPPRVQNLLVGGGLLIAFIVGAYVDEPPEPGPLFPPAVYEHPEVVDLHGWYSR